MSEWIRCSQKMPPKGKTVLVWHQNDWEFGMTFGGSIICIYESGGWSGIKIDTAKHDLKWQPLPPPPEDSCTN